MSSISSLTFAPDLAQQAYQVILDAICEGRLAPGERITQERLAESLSVSRQPVLQALLLLKRDGFIMDAPGRGVMIAPLTATHIVNLYQVRSVLDGLAAREAARRQANLAPGLLVAGREATREKALAAMIDADLAFHRAIYDAADNPLLSQSAERHWSHIRRTMGAVLHHVETRTSIWDEHEAMIDAIATGNAERAQQLAISHCDAAGHNLAGKLTSLQPPVQHHPPSSIWSIQPGKTARPLPNSAACRNNRPLDDRNKTET